MKRDAPPGPPPTPRPVLDVQGLSKSFTLHLRGGLRLPVLRDVALSVHAGQCLALLGPSGQGKSTVMKCVYGSYGADAGRILFAARDGPLDIAQASAGQVLALRREDMAYVSQFLRVVPRVSALDVVAERVLQAQAAGDGLDAGLDDERHRAALEVAREQARALLARLQLPESLWTLPPATFSGGEQQRVNIARGFVRPARLLLLDEPSASLDAANRRIVIGLIQEALTAGTAVLGIFHDPEVREAVATHGVTLTRRPLND